MIDEKWLEEWADGAATPGMGLTSDERDELLRLARLGLEYERILNPPLTGTGIAMKEEMRKWQERAKYLYTLGEWAEKHGIPLVRFFHEETGRPSEILACEEAIAALPAESLDQSNDSADKDSGQET